MEALGLAMLVIGGLIMAVGGIWILVLAFQESVLWGLGSLFIPFVILVFALTHFDKTSKPFFIWLVGLVFYLPGIFITISSAPAQAARVIAPTPALVKAHWA